jgi:NADH-quinone oxidoreductase subunit C
VNQPVIDKLKSAHPDSILSTGEFRGDLTVTVRTSDIVSVSRTLRDDPDLSFDLIVDLFGTDFYRPDGRFEVTYHLYSLKNKRYITLKVAVEENDPVVDSVTGVWPGANWHERETYDMIGVSFSGHPDLRRMYMPEEYEYYPLRKDFPLMGVPDSIPLPRK